MLTLALFGFFAFLALYGNSFDYSAAILALPAVYVLCAMATAVQDINPRIENICAATAGVLLVMMVALSVVGSEFGVVFFVLPLTIVWIWMFASERAPQIPQTPDHVSEQAPPQ